MKKYSCILLLSLIVLSSCKSTLTTVTRTDIKPLSTEQVVQNLEAAKLTIKTVNAKIRVRYSGNKKQSITAKLRLEKDSVIWISLTAVGGIPVAKMMIQPNHIQYYEKLDKVYFDGDFSLLNSWLKADLDFDKVQNMLFAQPLTSVESERFISSIMDNSYHLKGRERVDKSIVTYWVNPDNFKLNKQEFSKNKREYLAFSYLGFDHSSNINYPNKIQIVAKGKKQTVKIDLDYKSLQFNMHLSFPFHIPQGYKPLKIK